MARPGSRVRLLEASSNRRPREMIAAPRERGTEPGLQAFSDARFWIHASLRSVRLPSRAKIAGAGIELLLVDLSLGISLAKDLHRLVASTGAALSDEPS